MPYVVVCHICGHIYVASKKEEAYWWLYHHAWCKHNADPGPYAPPRGRTFTVRSPSGEVLGKIWWTTDKSILQIWRNPESRKVLAASWRHNRIIRFLHH